MATPKQIRRRGRFALITAVLVGALVTAAVAFGAVTTDKQDYTPGSVVTISGDNSNGAGYVAGNAVSVAATADNGPWADSCSATVADDGTWSCTVTLSSDPAVAVGSYSYVATSIRADGSAISESGTFTDGSLQIASSPIGTFTFNVVVTAYSDTGCTNDAGTPTTVSYPGTVGNSIKDANGDNAHSFNLHETGLSSDGRTFLHWDSNPTTADICVVPPSTANVTHTAYFGALPPLNSRPVVTANDASFDEGASTNYSASWTDADSGQTHTCTINFGDGSPAVTGTISPTQPSTSGTCSANHTYADGPNSYTITVSVNDGSGAANAIGSDTATATVNNVDPTITSFLCPTDPVAVNTAVSFTSVPFTDPGVLDTHTASFSWGDSSSSTGTVNESNGDGTVSGSHTYTSAGIYAPSLTVTDKDGGADTASCMYVVVYDPSAGFVTGGGWIMSPAGAYMADLSLTGKATFGFVSKYKKGANVPDGNTEFQFHAAGLDFSSTSYQWLVVGGAKATYKGFGTINGTGNYGFLLAAIDGQLNGGGGTDKFRIKIWDIDNANAVVYDNLAGATDTADPTTVLGGGSIVIHTK